MPRCRQFLLATAAALLFAVRGALAAVDIGEVHATNVGTSVFTVVWTTSEVSIPGVDVFSDSAGITAVTAGLRLEYFPLAANDPAIASDAAGRTARRALRVAAIDRRVVAVRVSGATPGTTYYVRPRTFAASGADNGSALVALKAVTTAQFSRMVGDARLAQVRVPMTGVDGMILLVQGPAGTLPLSAFIGDGAPSGSAVVPLANLLDVVSGSQAVLDSPQSVSVRVLGYGAPVGSSSHTINFGNTFNVAKYEVIDANLTSPAPLFTTQPVNRTIAAGQTTTFSVVASGTPAPTYRWQRLPVGTSTWVDLGNDGTYSGALTATLQVANAALALSGDRFRAIASNGFLPEATSNVATLIVTGTLAGFAPASGAPGSTVTLNGAGFTGTTAVRFNGIAASSFTVVSASQITAVVPMLGTSGFITIVTPGGTLVSSESFTVPAGPQLMNLVARAFAGTVENALLGSFTVEGTGTKAVLIRALGPALAALQVSGALVDPQLTVHDATGMTVASNNDWGTAATAPVIVTAASQVGALALADGSKDAALLQSFNPGTYTVRVTGTAGTTGVGLLEIYDAGTGPRVAYVSSRARLEAGQTNTVGFVVGGSGTTGTKTVLIRAVGTPLLPALGALTNPRLTVFSGTSQIGANDDWGTNTNPAELAAATAAVGAMPLATSDAALLLTLVPGSYTVQVAGPGGAAGFALTEVFLVDGYRAATAAPALLAPLQDRAAPPGATVYFSAPVVAQPANVTYQWKKDGSILAGGSVAGFPGVLQLTNVAAADAGAYTVAITNGAGTTLTQSATLTLAGVQAMHRVVGRGYVPGGTVTITNTLAYTGTSTQVDWQVVLPTGWSFASAGGTVGATVPAAGTTGLLDWRWTAVPASPFSFTYTLNVPAGQTLNQAVAALVTVTQGGVPVQHTAKSDPLMVRMATAHSADTDSDLRFSLLELTRVIELYSTTTGTFRTGRYQVSAGTEDDFAADSVTAAGAVVALEYYHSADSNRDGKVSLLELTRVIELYNYRSGTNRTGQYHIQAGSEDGFAPGP